LMAAALADAGFEVRLLPLFQTPAQVLHVLDDADLPDLIGVSSLAGAHTELLTELLGLLNQRRIDVPLVVGGIIPQADVRLLLQRGVKACFGPGQEIAQMVGQLIDLLHVA